MKGCPCVFADVVVSLVAALAISGCGEKPAAESVAPAEESGKQTATEAAAEAAAAERVAKIADIEKRFATSLHKTGRGMIHWYNTGSKAIVGHPYEKLDCSGCHVSGCDACHTDVGKYEAEVPKETCVKCHARYGATAAWDKDHHVEDVHGKMSCAKCHGDSDVHGTEKEWTSQRDPDAVVANCLDCHKEGKNGARKFDESIDAHGAHENLDCLACHVTATTSCLNCHVDEVVAAGSRKGFFFKTKQWLGLINYKGKVTSANIMTLVSNGKGYITYAPYFTHSIARKGRACGDCHGSEAAVNLAQGKPACVAQLEDGGIVQCSGVLPITEKGIKIDFADHKDGKWVKLAGKDAPVVTFSCYGEPLSEEQIKKLAEKVD